MNKNQH